MRIKPGVRVKGIGPEMLFAWPVIAKVYEEFGYECVGTSISDGRHSKNSGHHCGESMDFRTRHVKPADRPKIRRECARRLPGYIFKLKTKPALHMHVRCPGRVLI